MPITAGDPTVCPTVTVRVVAVEGPLHPVLTTFIVTLPDHPLGQVRTPVVALIAVANNDPLVLEIPVSDQLRVPMVAELL
jgi:hypothetical protein